jgi:anti-sigma factor ChrR (cupin superfamily)
MTNQFLTIQSASIEWTDGAEIFGPAATGTAVKILSRDTDESGQIDFLMRIPAGTTEPRHTHSGRHQTLILEGRQEVGGLVLGPHDYVYGPSGIPHGPFHYPEECLLFGTMRGATLHVPTDSPGATSSEGR